MAAGSGARRSGQPLSVRHAPERPLVVFDLDGTLTRLDTLPLFAAWGLAHRPWRVAAVLAALRPLVAWRLGLGAAVAAKQALLLASGV